MDVTGIISRAKKAMRVQQDQELANALGVNRTTIASWKRRHSIPAKYLSQMLDGGRVSLDWLMSGKGRQEQINEWGLSPDEDVIDPKVLWVALRASAADMYASLNEADSEVGDRLLDSHILATLHIRLGDYLKRVNQSKSKWEASGLVKGEDVYRALMTEFQAGGTYEEPTPPWWEDKSVI